MVEEDSQAEAGVDASSEPIGFKVVVKVSGLVFGLLFGLGVAVLLQQYGVAPMTTVGLIVWVLVGLLVGVAIPTLTRMIKMSRAKPGGGA